MNSLTVVGGGFIGARLALAAVGSASVTVIDRRPPPAKLPRSVRWRQHDLESPLDVVTLMQDSAAVVWCMRPSEAMLGTVAAASEATQRLVYLSSLAVYGSGGERVDENAQRKPTSDYGALKVLEEDEALSAGGTVVRLTGIYGAPYVPYATLSRSAKPIWTAVCAAQSGASHVVLDFFEEEDQYLFVEDLCDALLGLIATEGLAAKAVNVAQGTRYPPSTVCEWLGECLGIQVSYRMKAESPPSPVLDPRLLNSLLPRWSPTPMLAAVAKMMAGVGQL